MVQTQPIDSQTDSESSCDTTEILRDPDLLAEYRALTDPEDKDDFLEMIHIFRKTEEENYLPLEQVKSELGV